VPLRRFLAATACLFALVWAATAQASPSYPGVVAQVSGWPCSTPYPACTFCHKDLGGGVGTVVRNFGTYLRMRGLVMENQAALRTALGYDQSEGHVSNSNGIKDFDALQKCEDPNTAGDAITGPQLDPPAYGCGARISPRTPPSSGWALPLVVFAIVGAVRRRTKAN
jgi:MYXO-CTERM domain-containing protein